MPLSEWTLTIFRPHAPNARVTSSLHFLWDAPMILRIDQLQTELPKAKEPSPNAAAAVQELLGGKFGEMSTLMNYTFQSFNFRGRAEQRPFYDLIANIAAEEFSHIELVAYTINLLLTKSTATGDDPTKTP